MRLINNNLLRKSLICGGALVILSSLGFATNPNNINAKVRHNRTHRVYRYRHSNKRNNFKRYHHSNRKHNRKINKRSKKHIPNFLPKVTTPRILRGNQIKSAIQHTYILSLKKGKRNPVVKQNINLINQSILLNINHMTPKQVQSLDSTPDMYMLNISKKAKKIVEDKDNYNSKTVAKRDSNTFNHDVANDIKSSTSAPAWNNRGNNDYAKEIAKYVAQDINQFREQYGLKPLKISYTAQSIANMRSKQYTHDMETHDTNTLEDESISGDNLPVDLLAHGYDYHDTATDDGNDLGYFDSNNFGENAGTICNCDTTSPSDRFGDAAHNENNNTPQEIAYNDVNDMVNYDRFTKNGHRDAILSKYNKGMGVGVYYHSNGIKNDSEYAPSNGGIVQEFLF